MPKTSSLIISLMMAQAASVALSSVALAQDADTFNMSGSNFDNQGSLELIHPRIGEGGSLYGGLVLALASQPLVISYDNGTQDVLVGSQFSTRLQGGYNLNGKVRFDVEVPIYPSVKVYSGEVADSKFALGPIRLGALIPLLRYDTDGVGFGLAPYLDIPTGQGAKDAYVSTGFKIGATAAVGGNSGALGWRANLGLGLGPKAAIDSADNIEVLDMGSSLDLGGGLNYEINEDLLAGIELSQKIDMAAGLGPWNANPAEGHLYATYGGDEGLQATLGLGRGLIAGVGAPKVRVILGLGWRMPGGPPDTDLDGLTDDLDSCINDPEDRDEFQDTDGCPDPDNDSDGLLDGDDKCPNAPEDKDNFEDQDGCPDPDNDGDGLLDADDECPVKAGPMATRGCPDNDSDGLANRVDDCPDEAGPPTTNGCPDRDKDRVPDKRDKCPDEPIDPRADPRRSDGCPTRVVITREKIEILDKIYFDTNKATIKPVSYPLLDEVAKTLNNNPELRRIEVAGHTDSDGKDDANMRLSQARVDSVVKYLVEKGGVDKARLTPVGYGETKPVAPNDTADNKALNRRVEFVILEQDQVKEEVRTPHDD